MWRIIVECLPWYLLYGRCVGTYQTCSTWAGPGHEFYRTNSLKASGKNVLQERR